MMTTNKLYISIFLSVLAVIFVPFLDFFSHDSFEFETSVWCVPTSNETKLCKFKNICYDPQFKALLFFLGKSTVIKGFNHYSELQKVQLSSVLHHNQFYANLSFVDIENFNHKKEVKIHPKVLLISRIKPNNLMHTIHDDLFPVFLTLEFLCVGDLQCIESYTLMFHDNHPKGPFFNLYKLFSKISPILLNELLPQSNQIWCIKEMFTGLILDGVFYQYGFKKPHGPVKPSQLTYNDIVRFTYLIKNNLQIYSDNRKNAEVILFERLRNRKILNTNEVKKMIESAYRKLNKEIKISIITLDLYSNDLTTLIKVLSEADGLIGMHGAEMILSLFLKPKSYVVEMFPFGINPEVVSFLKPISKINDCNFLYFSWRNMIKINSVGHSDAHPLFGGISNLDKTVEEKIKNAEEVPPVECCNNPLFLFHMYQDTFVTNKFENFMYEILLKTLSNHGSAKIKQIFHKWFYPYAVSNFSCNFQSQTRLLHLSWDPPFNVENNLRFSLHIKEKMSFFSKDIFTEKTKLQVKTPVQGSPKFEVWISVYLNSNNYKSPDLYIICN